MRGRSTLTEDQGDRTPPHVNPKSTEVAEATMIIFPLDAS